MPRDGHPPYFPFYPDDFASDGDVEAMSTAQVGAYILLLCKAWREEPVGSVPDDDRRLARWARMTPEEWSEAKSAVLAPFALRNDGRWHQPRMAREFMKLRESSRRRAEAGAAGAESRWGNGKRMAKPKQSHSDANATAVRSDGMSPSSSVSNEGGGSRPKRREISTTEMQVVADAWNMLGIPFKAITKVHDKRRKHLAVRLADDWWRDNWRTALAKVQVLRFCRGGGDRGWVAHFDWFIKPNTVTEIMEGKYDDRPRTAATGQARRETSAEARERGNLEAFRGFAESHGVSLEGLFGGDGDAGGVEENRRLHGDAIESVARRVGDVPAGDD